MKFKVGVVILVSLLCVTSLTACSGGSGEDNINDDLNKLGGLVSNVMQAEEYPTEQNDDAALNTDYYITENVEPSKEMIDPFKGLEITYTGTAPYITAAINTAKCSDIINQNIRFTIEKDSSLKNGDEVKVTAVSTNDYYDVSETEKIFKVENQPELVTTLEGLDITEIQKELDDKLAVATAANKDDSTFAGVSLTIGDEWLRYFDYVESKELKTQYLIVRKQQYEDNNDSYNRYVKIYDYNLKTYTDDDHKNKHIYVLVYVDNIAKDSTGKLSWNTALGDDANDNYDSLINDNITSLRESYNITELKSEVKQESKQESKKSTQ